jgi:hypothetical protein
MKIPKTILILMLMIGLFVAGCAPAAAPAPMQGESMGMSEMPAAPMEMEVDRGVMSKNLADTTAPSPERLVIRNANLSIVVADPGKSLDTIAVMAEEMGGFVVTSNMYKISTGEGVEIPQAEITIRVPAEKLNQAMQKIKNLVEDPKVDVLSENVSGQDVTQEYTDTKSRLTNLEAAEKQLQAIMDEAVKTEDVLAVYNQLIQVREQIEVLKGQAQYYEQAAALSAISISLKAQAAVQEIVIGGWRPAGIALSAIQALINTFQILGTILIWLVIYIVPVGAVIVLFILALRFIWRKIFKPKPRTQQPPSSTPPQPPSQPHTLN